MLHVLLSFPKKVGSFQRKCTAAAFNFRQHDLLENRHRACMKRVATSCTNESVQTETHCRYVSSFSTPAAPPSLWDAHNTGVHLLSCFFFPPVLLLPTHRQTSPLFSPLPLGPLPITSGCCTPAWRRRGERGKGACGVTQTPMSRLLPWHMRRERLGAAATPSPPHHATLNSHCCGGSSLLCVFKPLRRWYSDPRAPSLGERDGERRRKRNRD